MADDRQNDQLPENVENVSSGTSHPAQGQGKAVQQTSEGGVKESSDKSVDKTKHEVAPVVEDKVPADNGQPPEGFLSEAGNEEEGQDELPLALLEFHSPTAAVINMPPTASAQYITWIIGALALFSFIAMCVFPLDKVVSAEGRLVSVDPPLIIQPYESSIIRSIDVREGDFVTKGQVLAHLDPTVTNADVENLKLQVQSEQAEYDRLNAESEGKDYKVNPANSYSVEQGNLFQKRKLEYNAKVEGFDQKINEQLVEYRNARATAAVLQGRLEVASNIHKMRKRLQEEEVGSRLSTLGSQDTLMDVESKLINAQQQSNAVQKKIASLQADRKQYIESWRAEVYKNLTLTQRQLSKDSSDFIKAKLRRKKILLVAEQDSIVLSIAKGSEGSILNSGTPFMTLIPVGTGLEVEAAIQGADVGYMKLGDKAIIKFNTFPYTQYGGAEAIITNISADVFQPGDNQDNRLGSAPQQFREKPFYRVRMRINKYTLHSVPNFFHPTPGLLVTADIHVGKRTVAQYLMNGVVPELTEGMRDPQ